jgi:hypothetical protein
MLGPQWLPVTAKNIAHTTTVGILATVGAAKDPPVDGLSKRRYNTYIDNKELTMTVKEMMEVLKQLDPNQEVSIYDPEWEDTFPVERIEVEQDGKVVLY